MRSPDRIPTPPRELTDDGKKLAAEVKLLLAEKTVKGKGRLALNNLLQTLQQALLQGEESASYTQTLEALSEKIKTTRVKIAEKKAIAEKQEYGPIRDGYATQNKEGRAHNEDAVLSWPEQHVYGVFDGMGGHRGGETASNLGVATIEDNYQQVIEELFEGRKDLTTAETETLVRVLLFKANLAIHETSQMNPNLRGMGTAGTVLKIWTGKLGEKKAILGTSGDVRGYIFRKEEQTLEQITEDQSMVKDILAAFQKGPDALSSTKIETIKNLLNNAPTTAELEHFPTDVQTAFNHCNRMKNVVTGFLGASTKNQPNLATADVLPGDIILLVSDGAYENAGSAVMTKTIKLHQDKAPNRLAEAIVNSAYAQSTSGHLLAHSDDITCQAVYV